LFEEAGFELEEFGDNMIKISGVPNIGYDMDYVELFKDTLDELRMESKTTKEEKEERFLATIACKAAVKGNMKLTATEHVALIDKMVKLDRPFTCPHGRPTAYEISKYEIERRFARK
jgi:DNA mismatch repair protein MutL